MISRSVCLLSLIPAFVVCSCQVSLFCFSPLLLSPAPIFYVLLLISVKCPLSGKVLLDVPFLLACESPSPLIILSPVFCPFLWTPPLHKRCLALPCPAVCVVPFVPKPHATIPFLQSGISPLLYFGPLSHIFQFLKMLCFAGDRIFVNASCPPLWFRRPPSSPSPTQELYTMARSASERIGSGISHRIFLNCLPSLPPLLLSPKR